jgi:LPXTG-motif cell wall-anchored protein
MTIVGVAIDRGEGAVLPDRTSPWRGSAGRAARGAIVVLVLAASLTVLRGGSRAEAAEAPVGLFTATSFAVLAGSAVTNTGPTVISGDLGVSPGSAVSGFPPGLINNGVIHAADAVAAGAQADITAAYNDAASRSTSATITSDLGGQSLVPGVYSGGALGLTGALTLNAQGDPNAVFVFQAASTLTTASASSVVLINGANPCNVYWQIGSSATLGTGTAFVGTVLALTSVSAKTGATVNGRLFARNGAVTLDTNVITRPTCAVIAPGSTTTTTASSASSTTSLGGAASTTVLGATTVPGGATTTILGSPNTPSTPFGGTASQLPRTGSRTTDLTILGVLAIASGAGLLLLARRRQFRPS